jgi:hypothetical protein
MVAALTGRDLGASEWLAITQERVDRFADATGDHQWIHVDPERAKAGPFGTTIAHGYLTLSLVIPLWTELLAIEGIRMAVNYGLNKVRFPAPSRRFADPPRRAVAEARAVAGTASRSSPTSPSRSTAPPSRPPSRRRVPVLPVIRRPMPG